MANAIWNGVVPAGSEETQLIEGNHYFPPESLRRGHTRESDAHTVCSWKETASYFDVVVGDLINEQAAWYYPDPKPKAAQIKNFVAFWKGVGIV